MKAEACKFMVEPLGVLVLAADPQRLIVLQRIVHELGHAVAAPGEASVVLADGVETGHGLPAVQLGASSVQSEGTLPGDASPIQIDAALRAIAAGLRVTAANVKDKSFRALEEENPVLLTPREVEVLGAVSNGLANKEIARSLGISLHTVKFHLESLMRKLQVSSRTEAVMKAMRLGLLESFRV